jgi:hypothetical protein
MNARGSRPLLRLALAFIAVGIALVPADAREDGIPLPRPEAVTRLLVLSPGVADTPDTTHSALAITRESYSGRISFAGRVQTVKQLRVGSLPNPWECAWLVWNYQDDQHFYYVALKPTGWEVGKRDPAYPGGQRFLASGDDGFAIGAWHHFRIVQADGSFTIRLNSIEIASFTDGERPYTSGKLGLYTEDAEVQLDGITAPFMEDFGNDQPVTSSTDGFVLSNWVAPFLGHGYVAVVDGKR